MKKRSEIKISFLFFGAFLSLCVFLFFFEISSRLDLTPFIYKAVEASAEAVIGDLETEVPPTETEEEKEVDRELIEKLFLLSGADYVPNEAPIPEKGEKEKDPEPENIGGKIIRKTYTYDASGSYIELPFGGLLRNCTDYSVDYILEQAQKEFPHKIELRSSEPQVVILHTHTTESFEESESEFFSKDSSSRNLDPTKNVTAIGKVVADILNENGINTLHVTETFDYPEYSGAYDRSSEYVASLLHDNPSVKIVIDLHRDAIESDGERYAPVAEINGKNCAQVMIICGVENVPQFRYNLRLATRLQSVMERKYPELARPLLFDERNYNQELSKGAFLIEIGSHANSLDEALYSGELLADCLTELILEELSAESE